MKFKPGQKVKIQTATKKEWLDGIVVRECQEEGYYWVRFFNYPKSIVRTEKELKVNEISNN